MKEEKKGRKKKSKAKQEFSLINIQLKKFFLKLDCLVQKKMKFSLFLSTM